LACSPALSIVGVTPENRAAFIDRVREPSGGDGADIGKQIAVCRD
jgi:hypothetical protein